MREVYLQVLEKRNNRPMRCPLSCRSLSAGSREEKQLWFCSGFESLKSVQVGEKGRTACTHDQGPNLWNFNSKNRAVLPSLRQRCPYTWTLVRRGRRMGAFWQNSRVVRAETRTHHSAVLLGPDCGGPRRHGHYGFTIHLVYTLMRSRVCEPFSASSSIAWAISA